MIEVTESAAKEITEIIKKEELDPQKIFLRVGVRGGGCSGFSYLLDLTEEKKENDLEFVSNGIKVVVDEASHIYLDGTKVDFINELMGRGFVFNNSNATGKCGCGSSFSV